MEKTRLPAKAAAATLPLLARMVRGVRAQPERAVPVIALGLLALCLYAFLSIADEMAEGELRRIDEMLFLLFRVPGDPESLRGPAWLEEAAVEVTAIGGYPLIVLTLAAVVGLFIVTRRYGPALYAVLSVGSGAILSGLLKQIYARPRPDLAAHLDTIHTASFPSGHATVTTVAYLTLAALVIQFFADRRVRIYVMGVAVVVAGLVGVSRVYLGVHWPSDVVAGWMLGTAWASFSWIVVFGLRHWRRQRRQEDEQGAAGKRSGVPG